LQPLFLPGTASWREHCFAEYHTHAAASNYFPQRSVRTQRYKLIENLLPSEVHPNEVHPDYDKTFSKLEKDAAGRGIADRLDLHTVVAQADSTVKQAYARMRQPPRYELYDLEHDPHEFHNLAEAPEYSEVFLELQSALTAWREQTLDPLLHPDHLRRLTEEVRSVKNKSTARKHNWGYPDYFFGREPAASEPSDKKKPNAKNTPSPGEPL
jgi:hypothetical protein